MPILNGRNYIKLQLHRNPSQYGKFTLPELEPTTGSPWLPFVESWLAKSWYEQRMSSVPKSNPLEPGLPRPDDPDAISRDKDQDIREVCRARKLGLFSRERERERVSFLWLCLETKFRGVFFYTGIWGSERKTFLLDKRLCWGLRSDKDSVHRPCFLQV
jgi:hypothetical protein